MTADLSTTTQDSEPGRVMRAVESVGEILTRPRSIPYLIVGSTFLLLTLGLLMVWSATAIQSLQSNGTSLTMVMKQGMFAVVGILVLIAVSRVPVLNLRAFALPFLIIVIALLIAVLIPGIGIEVAGQRNWIGLGSTLRIQPSEFAKLAMIIWGADTLARQYRRVTDLRGLLVPVLPVGMLLILLVLAEGDFGNAMILSVILAAMLFVAGAPLRLFAVSFAVGIGAVAVLAWMAPYRITRFTAFLNPEADPLGPAYQVTRGMYAFGSGGLFGVGLGASREKWGTLPARHTDFIFAVLGEELGLVGTISVLVLFGLLIFAILRLVHLTSDRFVQLLATGVAGWLMIQVITNVGATLKLLPITGVTLPFVSYGGSSLVPMLMSIGLVLVVAKYVVHGSSGPPGRRPVRRRGSKSAGRRDSREPTRSNG